MNNKIRVFVRSRPLRDIETRANIHIDEEHGQITVNENRSFQFDDVFSEDSKQIDVYMVVVSPLVHDLILGYNCSVFAYGPTGTGKTFTMEGDQISETISGWEADSLCGIIPRTINQLFEALEEKSSEFYEVKVSFLELYNEEAYDLLSPIEDIRKLKIYETNQKQIVDGLQEVAVKNRDDLHCILKQGASKRATAATQLNARSSRSHTIFTITATTIEGKIGKINLIDLAGSENIGRSGAQDLRAREAGSINQSLLTLGRVIKALVDKAPHIPYRESKLTRLLQNSLGGTTKTSLIATISPSNADLEDTLITLEYATRAKGITNKAVVNQSILSVSANQANEIIESLKQQLIIQEYKIRNEVAKEYRKESDKVKQYFDNRLNDEMKEFTQKINDSRAEISRLKGELQKSTEESEILKNDLQKALADNNNRNEDVHKLTSQIETYKRDLQLAHSDNSKLNDEIRTYRDEVQMLKHQLQIDHTDNKEVKIELNKLKNERNRDEGIEQNLQEATCEINRLKEEIQKLDRMYSDSHNENNKLNGAIKKLNLEIKKLNTDIRDLNTNIKESRDEIDRLGAEDNQTEALERELFEANCEIDRLKGELEIVGKSQSQECSPILTPKPGGRKVTRIKKNLLDVSHDYANVTFNNEDEIAQVDHTRSKKKIIACTRKREINQAISMSGKKRKLQAQDDQYEVSPVCKRVTRSRKKLF